jgi:hypothetical protein
MRTTRSSKAVVPANLAQEVAANSVREVEEEEVEDEDKNKNEDRDKEEEVEDDGKNEESEDGESEDDDKDDGKDKESADENKGIVDLNKYIKMTTGYHGVKAFTRNLVEQPMLASANHAKGKFHGPSLRGANKDYEDEGQFTVGDCILEKYREQSGKANKLKKNLAKSVLNGTKEAAALQEKYPSVLGFGVGFQPSEDIEDLSGAWSHLNMVQFTTESHYVGHKAAHRLKSMVHTAHVSSAGSPLQNPIAAHALTLFAFPESNYGGLGDNRLDHRRGDCQDGESSED